jgi:hypothetical protein
VPPGSADDAVRFVDLSGYADLFDDLQKGFPVAGFGPPPQGRAPDLSLLEVVRVGSFEASFVPAPRDFGRLDPRFRLPPSLVAAAPWYADFGFAVFKLAASAAPSDVHPMAFYFPRRDARVVFFPTVHVHDGQVHPSAQFDHVLYGQPSTPPPQPWWSTMMPAARHVDVTRAKGLVDPDVPVQSRTIFGPNPNEDVLIWS